MTEPVTDGLITYTGNSTTAAYDFDFLIQAKSHLTAYVLSSAGVQTDLTLTTHYAIPDEDVNEQGGGTLTLVNSSSFSWMSSSTLVTGYTLVLKRVVPLSQTVNLSTNSTTAPSTIEAELDKLTQIDQQQQRALDRVITAPDTDTAEPLVLPSATARANTILAFDADGEPTTAVLSSVGASITAQYVTLATDSSLTNERVLTGTANQITVTDNGAGGTVVLSIPATSVLTAASITDSGLTSGRVAIVGTSGLLEDDGGLTYAKATDILTVPVVKFTPGAAPSLANGQQWSDSTQVAPAARTGGVTEYFSRVVYSQTTAVTVANTASSTTLMTTPLFGTSAFPASYFTAGKILRATAYGTYGITGTPNLTLQLVNTIAAAANSILGTRITTAAGSMPWRFEAVLQIKVGGASGTFRGFCRLSSATATGANPLDSIFTYASDTAYDLTAINTWTVQALWSAADPANTITCNGVTLEVMG